MSRKEFGEKWKFKMTTKVSSFMKKWQFCILIAMVTTK
jgi:hypothetical protein